jgi:adenylate cyclase
MARLARRTRRRLLRSGALTLTVVGLLTAAQWLGLLAAAQTRAADLLFRSRTGAQARATVIVGIDETSYRELVERHGPMADWPRTLYADALGALHAAGARVIGLAILFEAPRPEDEALAAAMRRATVVVPVVAQGPRGFDPQPGVAQEFDAFVRPTPRLAEAAAGEGTVNLTTAQDSVVRRLPLLLRARGDTLPAFPLTVAALHARRPRVVDGAAAPGVVHAAGRAIPVDDADTMAINFLGPPAAALTPAPFTVIPFARLLDGTFDPAAVRDRIALLGVTVRGVDEHATPTTSDTRMAGVEILGHAVETILAQLFLTPAPRLLTLGLVAISAALAAALAALARPFVAIAGVAAALIVYVAGAVAAFEAGIVLSLVHPPAALVLGFAVALADRVVAEQDERRTVRETMGRYLSPAVSQWVLQDPDRLRLGGETRVMTVLFTDLRGFTGRAHTLGAERVMALLNDYWTEMVEAVLGHDGVLVQYAGDALQAFWNAPMDQPDHARRACGAALDMIQRMQALRPAFARRGWPDLDMGIGVNTGPVVAGNMGSRRRLAYTAVGDAVNVAARLEGLTKTYGTRIVIGESTRETAGDDFVYRILDRVAVVGRPEALRVWELVAWHHAMTDTAAAWLARWDEAVALYHARRWKDAATLFAELQALAPEDGPAGVYRQRVAALLEHPPPEDWDGVFVAPTK